MPIASGHQFRLGTAAASFLCGDRRRNQGTDARMVTRARVRSFTWIGSLTGGPSGAKRCLIHSADQERSRSRPIGCSATVSASRSLLSILLSPTDDLAAMLACSPMSSLAHKLVNWRKGASLASRRICVVSSAVVRRDGGVTPTQSTAHLLGSEGMWMTVSERSAQYSVGDTIVVKIGKKATKLTVVAVYPKPRKARLAKSGPCKTKK